MPVNIAQIEGFMYELANLFLVPVLLGIIALFLYAFYSLGGFAAQYHQRTRGRHALSTLRDEAEAPTAPAKGFPVVSRFLAHPDCTMRDIETFALKELEYLRIATRVAPMLGLVATMIPMGPALKALANGNVQGISENLIVAFTAVIFGLITASITFWIASIKKHWLVVEMGLVEDMISERDRIAPIEQRARCESSLTAPYDPVELPPRPEESYEAA